jgi:hypothetical protein
MRNKLNRRSFMLPLLFAGIARISAPIMSAADKPETQPATRGQSQAIPAAAQVFSSAADQALLVMARRAEELHIKGAAVVAFFEGENVMAWSSKMTVVGSMKNAPSPNDRGSNLLAIAYAKAAEMADTLTDSGSGTRPPMTGEFGWKGGVIAKGKTGYLIAAFSGGPAEDDVRVSRAGLEVLAAKL